MKSYVRGKETPTGIKFKIRENGQIKFEEHIFKNYFIIKASNYENFKPVIMKELKYISEILPNPKLQGYLNIYLNNNFDRYKLKSKFELVGITLYEADLMTHKRWLIDQNIPLNSKNMNWVMYDIETKDDSNMDKDIKGNIIANEPILSIAYKDNNGDEHFILNKNLEDPIEGEKELLRTHNAILNQYDMILGWNSYRFDDTYVKQRSEFQGITISNWNYINQLDYMKMFKKNLFPRIPSYSLNNTSTHVLGEGKWDGLKAGNGNIYAAWKRALTSGCKDLEIYNKLDVDLMYKMEQKVNFIKLHMAQADIVHCFAQETLHNSELWDTILLREYRKRGIVSPTKPNMNEIERRKTAGFVAGAYTFCLSPGVHDKVDVFDFKSFYPTTGDANNICVTTKIDKEYAIKNNIPYVTIPEDIHHVELTSTKNPFLLKMKKDQISKNKNIEIVDISKKDADLKIKEKYFRIDRRGVMADLFGFFIDERDKTKYLIKSEKDPDKKMELKAIDWSYKTIANSGYGVLGLTSFRYFDEDVANAITQFCRYVIKLSIEIAENNGFKVIQGDTDSIMFVNIENKINVKELEKIYFDEFDKVADKYNMKSKKFKLKDPISKELIEKDHFIVFEFEKTFKKMISIMKKITQI